MADKLVVVDSPEKARASAECFPGAEVVAGARPVLVPAYRRPKGKGKGFFSFNPAPGGGDLRAKLDEYIGKEIVVFLDDDPAGRYAAWLIRAYVMEKSAGREEPVVVSPLGIDDEIVASAWREVGVVDEQAGVDCYTRAAFDAALGRHLKRLIGTERGPGNLPLNFTTLAAIFLLAAREEEIKAFTPKPRWGVRAKLRGHGRLFDARLHASFDLMTDGTVGSEQEARHLVSLLEGDDFEAEVVARSPLEIDPPAPYRLAELLHDAQALLAIPPMRALAALRRLWRGVESGGRWRALVTTPFSRTGDSGEIIGERLRAAVEKIHGAESAASEGAEIAAGMICPLAPDLAPDDVGADLSRDEMEVYALVRGRALAAWMRPAAGELLQVEIAAGPESLFRASFRSIDSPGFLREFQGRYDQELLRPSPFAGIEEGERFDLVKLSVVEHVGVAAELYGLDTLFADLADFSITPEPRSVALLQLMLDHGYIETGAEGFLSLGPKAVQVTAILDKAFPKMRGISFSAYIEQTIAEVTSGRKEFGFALRQFEQTLMLQGKSLVAVKIPKKVRLRRRAASSQIIRQPGTAAPVAASTPPPGVTPGQKDAEEAGGAGDGAAAPARSDAVEAVPASPDDVAAAAAGEAVVPRPPEEAVPEGPPDMEPVAREDASPGDGMGAEAALDAPVDVDVEVAVDAGESEAGTQWSDEMRQAFEQALRGARDDSSPPDEDGRDVPEDGARPVPTDQEKQCLSCGRPMILKEDRHGRFWSCSGFPACRHSESWSEEENAPCPVCSQGRQVVKRTPVGKEFYVCSRPECDFIAWSRPHAKPCPVCGSPFLVEKPGADGGVLRCPRAGCDYSMGAGDRGAAPRKKKKIRVRRVKKGGVGGRKKVRIVRRRKK